MTLDELKALNPGRDDLELETVGDSTVFKYRGSPPVMAGPPDFVSGHLYRRLMYIANSALDRIAELETTAEDAKDGLLDACKIARVAHDALSVERKKADQ